MQNSNERFFASVMKRILVSLSSVSLIAATELPIAFAAPSPHAPAKSRAASTPKKRVAIASRIDTTSRIDTVVSESRNESQSSTISGATASSIVPTTAPSWSETPTRPSTIGSPAIAKVRSQYAVAKAAPARVAPAKAPPAKVSAANATLAKVSTSQAPIAPAVTAKAAVTEVDKSVAEDKYVAEPETKTSDLSVSTSSDGPDLKPALLETTKTEPTAVSETTVTKTESTAVSETAVTKTEPTAVSETTVTKTEPTALSETTVTKTEPAAVSETTVTKTEPTVVSETTVTKTEPSTVSATTVTTTEPPTVSETAVTKTEPTTTSGAVTTETVATDAKTEKIGAADSAQIAAVPILGAVSTNEPIVIDNDEVVEVESTIKYEELATDEGKTRVKTGAKFPVVISSEITTKTSKKGDPVEARLKYDLKIGDRLIAKKGAVVNGHINYSLPARSTMHSLVSPTRWYRNSGCVGISFDEIIDEKGQHLPLVAVPARAARIVKNKGEGRELGINHDGQVAGPLSQQIRYKAIRIGLNAALAPAGAFSFGAMPIALGVIGAANPSFAFMKPVGLNVRHRRIKGFFWGALSGVPGSWLIEDTVVRGQEAVIKPGDEFLAEFQQEFTGEPASEAAMMPNAKSKVHGEVMPDSKKDKK